MAPGLLCAMELRESGWLGQDPTGPRGKFLSFTSRLYPFRLSPSELSGDNALPPSYTAVSAQWSAL
jgi:hypothetical protein